MKDNNKKDEKKNSKLWVGITILVILLVISGIAAIFLMQNSDEKDENKYLLLATKNGIVKKTNREEFKNINKAGLIAIGLREDDELIGVKVTDGNKDILLVTKKKIGPFLAINTKTYNDGGTKEYYGLGYKVIDFNMLNGYDEIKIGSWFMKYEDFENEYNYINNDKSDTNVKEQETIHIIPYKF